MSFGMTVPSFGQDNRTLSLPPVKVHLSACRFKRLLAAEANSYLFDVQAFGSDIAAMRVYSGTIYGAKRQKICAKLTFLSAPV
jgi:hypothetical protein